MNLSLRHNNITDKGAAAIGKALSTEKTCNKNLISLSLGYNRITDEGAEAIANVSILERKTHFVFYLFSY